MIVNPYFLHPTKGNAWGEGFWVAFFRRSAPAPSDLVSPDDYDAFNEGVVAGVAAAETGYPVPERCVSLLESEPSGVTVLTRGASLASDVVKLLIHGVSRSLGLVLSVVRLVSLETFYHNPADILSRASNELLDVMRTYGLSSNAIYLGGGIDRSVRDCELQLTNFFPDLARAREAAQATGRPEWIIVSWRTDMSNSFEVVESNP
jgi:hypothetical protein